jgi:hypothetical protein
MPLTYEQIVSGLRTLKESDFDLNNPAMDGPEVLRRLTDAISQVPEQQRFVPDLFAVMERLPTSELGSPGPLVHTLERMQGFYEGELINSVRRSPTPLTVWMVNRLLNTELTGDERSGYLALLEQAAHDARATDATRKDASRFLKLHVNRDM